MLVIVVLGQIWSILLVLLKKVEILKMYWNFENKPDVLNKNWRTSKTRNTRFIFYFFNLYSFLIQFLCLIYYKLRFFKIFSFSSFFLDLLVPKYFIVFIISSSLNYNNLIKRTKNQMKPTAEQNNNLSFWGKAQTGEA